MKWKESIDNAGVHHYIALLGGRAVGEAPDNGFTFRDLKCATSYTLGVYAVDAAGNRSDTETLSAKTSTCPATTRWR